MVGNDGNWVGTTDPDCVARFTASQPAGTPLPASCYPGGPGTFVGSSVKFKGEISPRLGIIWDVLGNSKSKLYGGFARLYERVPNDLAVRSFGNEYGVTNIAFRNPDLSGQYRWAYTTGAQPTRVQPNTRLPYKDDFNLGYQFEAQPHFVVDVKANFRRQGRILEDTQTSTVEAIQNYSFNYLLGANGSPNYCMNCAYGQTELFPGAGYAQFGEYVLANVGDNAPATFNEVYPAGTYFGYRCPGDTVPPNPHTVPSCDGQPTGVKSAVSFGRPKSEYKALSITLTKSPAEGEHLSLQATYRISRLTGNYEGLFRNDNGQSDPNITSLFDFPDSPLLHSQYKYGVLNTDTPHSLKINVGYRDLFVKNLYGSLTFKWQSGQVRTPQLAHPVYQNSGEVPGFDPQYYFFDTNGDGFADLKVLKSYSPADRGSLGRLPDDATWDLKLGYKWVLSKSNFDFSVYVRNLFNDIHISKFDDDVESSTAVKNPSYGLPIEAKAPRSIRLGISWTY